MMQALRLAAGLSLAAMLCGCSGYSQKSDFTLPSFPGLAAMTGLGPRDDGKATVMFSASIDGLTCAESLVVLAQADGDGFKTVPQGVTDLIAGRIDLMVANLGAAIPQVQAKRLRALAVTGGSRWPLLPDTPIMKESGLPNYEWTFWNAAWLPANTPPEIVTRMSEWFIAGLERPRVKDYLLNSGSTAFGTTPAELMKFQIAEHDKWRKVILAAKIAQE